MNSALDTPKVASHVIFNLLDRCVSEGGIKQIQLL